MLLPGSVLRCGQWSPSSTCIRYNAIGRRQSYFLYREHPGDGVMVPAGLELAGACVALGRARVRRGPARGASPCRGAPRRPPAPRRLSARRTRRASSASSSGPWKRARTARPAPARSAPTLGRARVRRGPARGASPCRGAPRRPPAPRRVRGRPELVRKKNTTRLVGFIKRSMEEGADSPAGSGPLGTEADEARRVLLADKFGVEVAVEVVERA
jgi:hypothetical protein